ncbi:enterobactin transporter EntS [Janthinobacterium sp. B9-8]|uniref:enterobactin transporter EntS n=1 Tax=Janthinobacterium sp. B9-8 TaxID=1236179 RepID=UPI00061D0DA5|nr:enterobactin transporter EntS [Janthinobacterium sp. B9-8]AMC37136.1 POT family transporter [Janthinobacterium sp. B9-8]
MSKPRSSIFVDFSLLKNNSNFRSVFIARLISVLSLGMLTVAVPVQIHALTGSALHVGLAVALDGVGMFVGLMCGGVLADRYDRRKLILMARCLCGIGFLVLALNSFIAAPSLLALYLVAVWDGFFGALGITALMASIPALVGRENLSAAGALSMLTVRLGAILSPAIAGVVIASAGVSWNYLLAGLGTLCTLIPLLCLPSMQPAVGKPEHPLRALADGVHFLMQSPVVGAVVVMGTLQTMLSAIRVMFPVLAVSVYGGGAFEVGLMYSAVPLGAMTGAFTSGWVARVQRPGLLLIAAVISAALVIVVFGLISHLPSGLVALVIFGYLGSISSLLQFTLVQQHTPDRLLGRVNSLWSAQDVVGDSVGALGLGALARAFAPLLAVCSFAGSVALAGAMLGLGFSGLRRLQNPPPETEPLLPEVASEAAH